VTDYRLIPGFDRDGIYQRHPDEDFLKVAGQPDEVRYQTIRGVTMPIEPGMSSLRIEIERNKARKRMRGDDRKLANLNRAIAAAKKAQTK
jgi:hypothetical protein